jgi:hypothetical protein
VVVPVAVLVAAFVGFLAAAYSLEAAGLRTRHVAAGVFAFATEHGRMPASFDEMIEAGYARPAEEPGVYVISAEPGGPALEPAIRIERFEVPWGLEVDRVVGTEEGIFWRDAPGRRVLLVRHREPPWVVRALSGRMAKAFPVELYEELGGEPPAAGTQPGRPRRGVQ